jgi:hypothetical protein
LRVKRTRVKQGSFIVEPKMRIELTTYALRVRLNQNLAETGGEKSQPVSPS